MKKCTYCGKEYPDDATACAIDAQPLASSGGQAGGSASGQPGAAAGAFVGSNAARDAAKKNMVVGGLWCAGGIVVTVVTYGVASSSPTGGSYFVAWGAILFGAIQLLRGLADLGESNQTVESANIMVDTTAKVTTDNRVSSVTTSAQPEFWTCATCGEKLEPQFTTCWRCRSPRVRQ